MALTCTVAIHTCMSHDNVVHAVENTGCPRNGILKTRYQAREGVCASVQLQNHPIINTDNLLHAQHRQCISSHPLMGPWLVGWPHSTPYICAYSTHMVYNAPISVAPPPPVS